MRHKGDYVNVSEALAGIDRELEFLDVSADRAYRILLEILSAFIPLYVPVSSREQRCP